MAKQTYDKNGKPTFDSTREKEKYYFNLEKDAVDTGTDDVSVPAIDTKDPGLLDTSDFDTESPEIGKGGNASYTPAEDSVVPTGELGEEGEVATVQEDGTVDLGFAQPSQREVQQEELVSHQLPGLLNSNSKFMQDARRQGLEQSNALGGLGGTVGVGASMSAAMRSALPIAESDANAYRDAAKENLLYLNQFAQLNLDRATKLELGHLDSRTRTSIANLQASVQTSIAKMQDITQRDISRADNATKLRITEMNGIIQDRLANSQFQYNQILNAQNNAAEMDRTHVAGGYDIDAQLLRNEGALANTDLQGQWQSDIQGEQNELQRETNYINSVMGAYDVYLQRIADLNGQEMDDAARQRSLDVITQGAVAEFDFIKLLFPDLPPINFGDVGG